MKKVLKKTRMKIQRKNNKHESCHKYYYITWLRPVQLLFLPVVPNAGRFYAFQSMFIFYLCFFIIVLSANTFFLGSSVNLVAFCDSLCRFALSCLVNQISKPQICRNSDYAQACF